MAVFESEHMFGKVVGVTMQQDKSELVIQMDTDVLIVSSKWCSTPPENYVGQFYTFRNADILGRFHAENNDV